MPTYDYECDACGHQWELFQKITDDPETSLMTFSVHSWVIEVGGLTILIDTCCGNHKNRGELYLEHRFNGPELKIEFAHATLEAVYRIWKRPVNIQTVVDGKGRILCFDGSEHREIAAEYRSI